MIKQSTLYLFLFVFILVLPCNSQPVCTFKHYSTNEGLSHNGIMCILEDHKGFMWFGTWDGLNRFDGYNFTHYKSRPGDSCQLSHNRIDDIKEDKFGFLWVKTYDEKIHRFDRRRETFQGIPHSIKEYSTLNIRISNTFETSTGEIWLIAKNMGCFRVITNPTDLSLNVIHYSSNFNDKYLLLSNNVNFIFEDSEKDIWIGTDKGLQCILGRNQKKIENSLTPINGSNVTTAFETEGNLWFGTADGKLINYTLPDGQFVVSPIRSVTEIRSICKLRSGLLMCATGNKGLFTYNLVNKAVTNYTREKFPELGDNRIESLYQDKCGVIWIETASPGVVRFKPESNNFKRFQVKTDPVSPFVYYGNFYKVFEDINNTLWLNLNGGGFCYYNRDADRLEYFYNEPGSPKRLFSNLTTAVLSDSHGNLWLSTYSRGIENVCFLKNNFRLNTLSPDPNALSTNNVRAVFEDRYMNLWVGTKHGELYCFDKNRKLRKVFSRNTRAPGDIHFDGMVYTIFQDRSGNLWFGTKGDGIIQASFTGNPSHYKFTTEHYKNNPNDLYSISNDFIYAITEDSHGSIWIGTFGGGVDLLERKDGKTRFRNSNNCFTNYPSNIFNKVRYLQEDALGRIWAGTTNGLIIFKPNKNSPDSIRFYYYQKTPGDIHSLASNDVHYIFRDKFNIMWIGTFGGGLNKLITLPKEGETPKFKTFNTASDLPVDIVLGIQEDKKGNLWVSTENGISLFKSKEEKFINFSELDGLKKTTFSEASCGTSQHGDLYFGCSDGYYAFKPDSILVDNTAPLLTFINLQLFNKNVTVGTEGSPLKQAFSETKSITLNYNQSVFSIEYAGLDFRKPEKLEYAFMLEGFEKEWNFVRNQRKATYTNLPAGKYTFKVKCTSSGIFDNKTGNELEIIILPPWWRTKWAYTVFAILLIIVIFVIRRTTLEILKLRNKVIIEQQLAELKIKFFTNISHELRTPLTLIIGPTEELLKNGADVNKTKSYLDIIDKNARRMLRHINQLLDFRKIETGKMRLSIAETEMVSFVKDIYSGFKELAISKNIGFNFVTNSKKIDAWIDQEKIDTAIFNLLSNAFKFTPENKSIEVIVNNLENTGYFEIIVKDQGIGIAKNELPFLFERFAISHSSNDLKTKGTGIGLSLVKEIVDIHQGKVLVDSIAGQGSTFILRLKHGKDHYLASEVEFDIQHNAKVIHSFNQSEIESLPHNKSGKIHAKEDAPVILLIEDNIDLRSYVSHKLIDYYNVEEAADGLEGWNKAQSLQPDIIISDIMMPKMDGIELTDKLRNEFKTSHIPIILLTAKSSVESMIEGLRYGADAYITKPFSMDLLVARITNLLQQRKHLIEKFTNQVKIIELSPEEIIVTSKDEQFLKDVIKIIEENMADPEFNVEMIATKTGLGRTTFFKKLKGLTGMAPVEFMKEMRVKRGHQLLETGNFTVSEIAYQVGFNDAGYFSKCFKEKYNQPPTEFLKAIRKV